MTLIPIQLTFRGLAHSDALETEIRDRVKWLEQFHPGIVRCRVVVEIPHRHRQEGRHVHVHIELTVPGGEPVVVSHEPSTHGGAKDFGETAHHKDGEVDGVHRYASVAVHEAFDAARRRLEDVARQQRGDVKWHDTPAHGQVAEISPIDGFGFIREGERLVYFHRASVLNDAFEQMVVGTPVAFAEEQGDKGPQATTVRVLGKHHYVGP